MGNSGRYRGPQLFELVNSQNKYKLTDELSLSSNDSSSGDDLDCDNGLHPAFNKPPPFINDFPPDELMQLDQEVEEVL